MKTIGLIGGMSWESSLEYYRIINETVKEKLGGLHSADCLMYSFDFQVIEKLQHQGDWEGLTELMIEAAQKLERGGAEMIVICTNTMHKMADAVQNSVSLPLLHIADVTAEEIKAKKMTTVGLLGTRFTMEEDFYRQRLKRKHGLEVIIPDEKERETIHSILYDELCLGQIKDMSKETFKGIIDNLSQCGAEGVILGCTEIPLLVEQKDYQVTLFDTTAIHARAAVEFALSG
jgi:aspartate racemase